MLGEVAFHEVVKILDKTAVRNAEGGFCILNWISKIVSSAQNILFYTFLNIFFLWRITSSVGRNTKVWSLDYVCLNKKRKRKRKRKREREREREYEEKWETISKKEQVNQFLYLIIFRLLLICVYWKFIISRIFFNIWICVFKLLKILIIFLKND